MNKSVQLKSDGSSLSDEPILKVTQLKKTFRIGFFRKKVEAIKNVSFEVHRGEIFGLLGPNGAGKTSTLKTMMGLIKSDGGSISIYGKAASTVAAREKVGYLPENPYFHEYLTPIELLSFYGKLHGVDSSDIKSRITNLIKLVDLEEAAKRPLRKFSKGMLQRVGLAQSLISDPQLLILDEPMTGLDPIGRKSVVDIIDALNKKGTTILFSSHILSDVERLCDKVVILNKGEKVAEGRLSELVGENAEEQTLESLFVKKALLDSSKK